MLIILTGSRRRGGKMKERPEDSFGYWLFYAQRSWAYAFNEALKTCCQEHGKPSVTPPQWGVLSALLEEDGLTIGVLSQRRALDAPTITGIVKRLEQVGLVSVCMVARTGGSSESF